MQVRGSVVSSIDKFVATKHPASYAIWKERLSRDARNIVDSPIKPGNWYPFEPGVIEPTQLMCELCYGGDAEGAWESGRYSAEFGLTGIYKVFVVVSTPTFLIRRASRLLATFYDPSEVEVVSSTEKSMVVRFTKLPAHSALIENRICGWMEKALEICGCKDLSVKITQSFASGGAYLEITIHWK